MSDLMLEAIIRMPYEMAMQSELSRRQFYERANQALDEMQAYADARVKEALEEAASIADRQHFGGEHDDDLSWTDCAAHIAQAIRQLIPQ